MKISIVIQAGGQSKRMGQDKGLVSLAGRPMIEHVIEGVDGIGDEITITTNNPNGYQYLGIRMASDTDPGAGALTGLHTALEASQGETVFVIACDMPFPNQALIQYLLSLAPKADAVVPFMNNRYQPLHAVYSREPCLQAIRKAIANNQKRAISFYSDINVFKIEEQEISKYSKDELSFFNVNTPTDLAKAEAIINQAKTNSDKI